MSKPLSYQSTRCVLQYFDSTERFLLTSRCPAIKQFEKSIPLRLENLEFTKDSITLNDLRFCLNGTYSMKRAGRGEVISCTSSYSVTITKEDQRMKSGKRTIVHCTTRIQISKEKAFEKLACILLGERNTVYVKKMEIKKRYPENIEWPANTQVAMDILLAEHHTFEYVLRIISDASPLKHLDSQFSNKESFDNELVKRAGTLCIREINESCYPKLATLRNKAVNVLNSLLPKEVIINTVKNWKEEGREIGTFLYTKYEEDEEDIIFTLKNRFKGKYGSKLLYRPHSQLNVSMSTSSTIFIHKDFTRSLTMEAVCK
ncbi:hypothetical protein GCK72_007263 [Caenorhabditis remanei]|uniref:DUF38 domain-containing protein n=1 Tax=Caenorhabditis remanei TaxID=31234 RepID=A0A6A5HL19_CAERE|nr:hypothetical protein GCK72_007263 [Caenorhabditis remanei]KAF1767304.1 hypothetical protein GCK72_007263 [Caenorhabditis remanei]